MATHMSKPAKAEQMAMNISAWSWTVESRLFVNAVPTCLPMSSSFAVKLWTRGELNTYWQRVNETLVGHNARVLMDRGRFLILEGQGPVQGVTAYEFPTKDAARNWHDSVAYRELRQHRKKGAKYLVVLTEGGVPPVEQRMPQTRVAGLAAPR